MSNPTEFGTNNLPDLDRLRQIGGLVATQDNRCTDQPMFIVQQRRRVYGLDADYCENVIWLCSEDDYSEASAEEAAELEAEYQKSGRVKSGWQRTGYTDQWEFVTACFTEQGCKDYLQRDGHNLKEPRIYAEGSYRNEEFRAVRDALIALARRAQPEGEARPTDDKLWDETLRDRDTYHEWADKLAGAIAIHFGVDIGEHSNQNCPWHEALEVIESSPPASKPEGEAPQAELVQQRYIDELDAGLAGERWLDRHRASSVKMLRSDEPSGGMRPPVKWVALFDQHDRLTHGYMLTRDLANWTHLTLIDTAPAAQHAEKAPSECERIGHAYEVYSADGKQRCAYCSKEWLGQQAESGAQAWDWDRRAEAARSFLSSYADTNMEVLLEGYHVQPIIRRLAAAIQEWQLAAQSQGAQSPISNAVSKYVIGLESKVAELETALAAKAEAPMDDNELARLRRVVRALSLEKDVPQDDATLRGCLFSVLGMIALKLERAQQAAAPGASIDTPEFRELLAKVWNGSHPKFNSKSIAALVAHIDNRPAPSAPGTPEAPKTTHKRLSEEEVRELAVQHLHDDTESAARNGFFTFSAEGLDGFAIDLMDRMRAAQLDGGQGEGEKA